MVALGFLLLFWFESDCCFLAGNHLALGVIVLDNQESSVVGLLTFQT